MNTAVIRLLVLLLTLVPSPGTASAQPAADPIVIELGKTHISRSEFNRLFDVALRLLAFEQGITLGNQNPEKIAALRKQFLNQRANEMTLVAEAERRNIRVGDEEVAAKFKEALSALTSDGGKVDEEVLRALLKDKQRVALLTGQLLAEIEVRPGDVMVMYHDLQDQLATPEQICMRHIQVADEATANRLLTQLKDGADFAETARQNSTDSATAKNGGDTGCFAREHMIPSSDFERAAFNAKTGDLTGPVSSEHGYHLLIVYERKKAEVPTLNQVYKDLEKEIRDGKLPEKLTAIRDAGGVITFPDRLGP